jgi:hypothetical protein
MGEASWVIQIAADGMGQAPRELRQKLIGSYLQQLADSEPLPDGIAFYAEGVKLAAEGSAVIESLRALEARGAHLMICTTCLEYFGLRDKVAVGTPGSMMEIVAMQKAAGKVVTI